MRKQVRVFVAAVSLLVWLLLLLPSQSREVLPLHTPPPPHASHKLAATPTAHDERIASLQVPYANPVQAAMLWSNAFPEQAVRYAAAVRGANAPIHFFGLCVDQDGKPLAGVSIRLGVRYWKGISPIDLRGEGRKFERTSDATGRFELTGTTGDVAGVDEALKPGYVWIRSGTASIDFSVAGNRIPNPGKPVVLQFWKKLPTQPVYAAAPPMRQKVQCDGTPSLYDLKAGLVAAQRTDVTVQFQMQRDPQVLNASTTKRPSWSLAVEIPGGAVQLAFTNMPFVAPAEGYVGQVVFGFDAADAGWSPRTNATLYYRTGGGMYGRLDFDVTATTDGPVAALNWSSILNPSGSPVLEYDPAKRLKPPARSPAPGFQAPAPASIPPSTLPSAALPPVSNRPAPFPLQPPPGFQALTNRVTPFAPPIPPRP